MARSRSRARPPPHGGNGANGFVLGTDGGQLSTFDLNQYGQNEPAGVALDPATHLLYSSHDSARRVYVISPGADGAFNNTGDSLVRQFWSLRSAIPTA